MSRTTRLIPLLATAATLAVPAFAQADTFTFGSRLDHEPSNSAPGHNCREDGSDDPTPACTRVAIDQSFAVPGGLVAPADGTIIKFSVRAGAPGTLTFRLAQLQNLGFDPALGRTTALGRGAGVGPTVNVQGNGFRDPAEDQGDPIESFSARLRVHKGDFLAIDSTSASTLYCSGGGANQLIFDTPLGAAPQQSTKTDGCELMVQAEMVTDPPVTTTTTVAKKTVARKKHKKVVRHRHHRRHHHRAHHHSHR